MGADDDEDGNEDEDDDGEEAEEKEEKEDEEEDEADGVGISIGEETEEGDDAMIVTSLFPLVMLSLTVLSMSPPLIDKGDGLRWSCLAEGRRGGVSEGKKGREGPPGERNSLLFKAEEEEEEEEGKVEGMRDGVRTAASYEGGAPLWGLVLLLVLFILFLIFPLLSCFVSSVDDDGDDKGRVDIGKCEYG